MLSDQTNSYDVHRVNEPPKHYLWCLPTSKKAVSFVSAALRKCAVTHRQIVAKFDKQKNTSGSAYEICKVWDFESNLAFQIAKRFKDIDAARFSDAPLMSHNQYCVYKTTTHYRQRSPSLPDRLLRSLVAAQQNLHSCNGGAA